MTFKYPPFCNIGNVWRWRSTKSLKVWCWFLQLGYFRVTVQDNLHLLMTSSFWLEELNIWFVIVFVVTEVLDSHQHPARLSFHRLRDSISIGRIYIIACHFWPAKSSPATVTLSFVRWLDLFGSINIQFLYANSRLVIIAFK